MNITTANVVVIKLLGVLLKFGIGSVIFRLGTGHDTKGKEVIML